MGRLYYGNSTDAIVVEDRELAHLKMVTMTKLRRSEGFSVSFSAADQGRSSVWVHCAIPLRFEFDSAEVGELGEIRGLEAELAELLSADDVTAVAEALEPGSAAGLLVYENLWAAPFASAVRRAGGQLVANGRIPVQALLAAIEEDLDDDGPQS